MVGIMRLLGCRVTLDMFLLAMRQLTISFVVETAESVLRSADFINICWNNVQLYLYIFCKCFKRKIALILLKAFNTYKLNGIAKCKNLTSFATTTTSTRRLLRRLKHKSNSSIYPKYLVINLCYINRNRTLTL